MEPFHKLKENKDFWNTTLDGICILANEKECLVYNIGEQIEDHLFVSDVFYIIPLLKVFGDNRKYNLLGFNGNEFNFYKGDKNGLEEIVLGDDVPRTIKEVLGDQYTEKFLNHDSGKRTGGNVTFHGQGSKKDEVLGDLTRYFQYIDKLIFDNYSKITKSPLLLVALTENQGLFRKISNNSYLMEEGIETSFNPNDVEKLTSMAWKIMESKNVQEAITLLEEFNQAKANNMGSDELHKIKKAALDNRVKLLMIEDCVDMSEEIDKLVRIVLTEKGQIVVLPKDQIPCDTGIAAIYRY